MTIILKFNNCLNGRMWSGGAKKIIADTGRTKSVRLGVLKNKNSTGRHSRGNVKERGCFGVDKRGFEGWWFGVEAGGGSAECDRWL